MVVCLENDIQKFFITVFNIIVGNSFFMRVDITTYEHPPLY